MANYQTYLDSLTWKTIEYRGKQVFKTCWMVKGQCSCSYKYGKQIVQPRVFDETMVRLTCDISKLAGFEADYFNSCNLNAYLEESSFVEWHSENEDLFREGEFKRDVDIVSLSMGGARNI